MKKILNGIREKLKSAFCAHTKEKITAILFIAVIFGMLIGMFTENGGVRAVWDEFRAAYRESVETGAPYLARIKGAIGAAENTVSDTTYKRKDFIELYGLAQLTMGKHVITDSGYGSLYKTASGQITFSVPKRSTEVRESAESTAKLANELSEREIDFLYIQLPFKIAPAAYGGEDELPENVHDYANENADAFLAELEKANVSHYDIRDEFWQSGMTQSKLFFDTDHHWTIEGPFYATGLVSSYLNSNYDMKIPENLYTADNFNFETRKADYIGSMGRRVGKVYGGIDDFTLITPNFETNLTVTTIDGDNVATAEGTFEEAVLVNSYIDDSDVETNRYAVYHGDNQELRFVNHKNNSGKKILIIKDSFSLPVYSFLSLGISEVRAIDMRLFVSNVAEYAESYDPDLVILMYNADSFTDPMFDFHIE